MDAEASRPAQTVEVRIGLILELFVEFMDGENRDLADLSSNGMLNDDSSDANVTTRLTPGLMWTPVTSVQACYSMIELPVRRCATRRTPRVEHVSDLLQDSRSIVISPEI
jgi:hypothetical protein